MNTPVENQTGWTDFVVQRAVAVTMCFLAVLVFGFVGYLRLPIELMPDISYPTLTVRTAWEGAAPQELENRISQPVEEAVATLDGLKTLQSRSRAGTSDVVLGFEWGTDMAGASQAIRENLQRARLPDGADRPLLLRYDPSLEPFLRLALSGEGEKTPGQLARIREVADDEVKRALEGMSGVAAVRVRGGFEREVQVRVREDWLAARKLTLSEVEQTLARENINIAGGSVLEGDTEFLVRTLNEYEDVDALRSVRIRRSDGIIVPLTDVAVIVDAHQERRVLSRLDGSESVELEVFKEADANIVQVAASVDAALFGDGGLEEGLPEGLSLTVLDDQAGFIGAAVSNLRSTAILGGLFAVCVLFLFLRDWRSTAIIGLAIPVSVIIGFAPLYLWGVSLNLMSLGGLALGVGMLVDNAVVVLESIQRYREQGLARREAAARGTSDVAAAVVASTLTTVAVFAPIAFVEGVAGELFGDLALAVVSSLIASLAVALLLVPTLAGLQGKTGMATTVTAVLGDAPGFGAHVQQQVWQPALTQWQHSSHWARERWLRRLSYPYLAFRLVTTVCVGTLTSVAWVVTAFCGRGLWWLGGWVVWPVDRAAHGAAAVFQRVFGWVERLYTSFLASVLAHGMAVALVAFGLLGVALVLVPFLGTELIPEVHQGRFVVDVSLPVGTPLARTTAVSAQLEKQIQKTAGVRAAYATIGSDMGADARPDEGENTARIRVELERTGAAFEASVMESMRADLEGLASVQFRTPSLFSASTPVEVILFGDDLDGLRDVGDAVTKTLSQQSGLVDVQSSLVDGHPEVRILYDRDRLHRLGLDPNSVANQVRNKVQGSVPTALRMGPERIDLRVQLVEADRNTLADLQSLNVNPNLRPVIPLASVADFVEAVGPSEIRRVDQQRAVVVSANLAGFDLGSAGSSIESTLRSMKLPAGTTWLVAGQSTEMEESLSSLLFALGLAVFLVYVIMASTFENLGHPFVILFSIPLALIGVVPSLALTGQAVSVVVFIGLIVLAGVVVNNAIVLVDTINRRRDEGLVPMDAIVAAGQQRLRPILITTATTVLGLAPLSLGLGAGAEIQQPLAITVIGGLCSSTLLTLVVVPIVYSLFASRSS